MAQGPGRSERRTHLVQTNYFEFRGRRAVTAARPAGRGAQAAAGPTRRRLQRQCLGGRGAQAAASSVTRAFNNPPSRKCRPPPTWSPITRFAGLARRWAGLCGPGPRVPCAREGDVAFGGPPGSRLRPQRPQTVRGPRPALLSPLVPLNELRGPCSPCRDFPRNRRREAWEGGVMQSRLAAPRTSRGGGRGAGARAHVACPLPPLAGPPRSGPCPRSGVTCFPGAALRPSHLAVSLSLSQPSPSTQTEPCSPPTPTSRSWLLPRRLGRWSSRGILETTPR